MKDMKKTVLATVAQKARIFAMYVAVMYELLEKITFDKAQALLSNVGEKEVKKRLMADFDIPIDPWATEKARLENFWLTIYGYQINWDDIALPKWTPELSRLEIDPVQDFTAEQLYDSIVNCEEYPFEKRSKYMDDIDKALDEAKVVQSRPAGNYAFAHVGGAEPDQKHLGKSYDDTISSELIFMGPREYLIACARNEFETGNVYDIKCITRLSVLGSGGYAMYGCWGVSFGSRLRRSYREFRNPDGGPRVVVFSS